MARARRARTAGKSVETLTHEEAKRPNLPSAEHQPLMREEEQSAVRAAYERRNRDLDPQLVWRGKDEQDSRRTWWSTSRPCTSRSGSIRRSWSTT